MAGGAWIELTSAVLETVFLPLNYTPANNMIMVLPPRFERGNPDYKSGGLADKPIGANNILVEKAGFEPASEYIAISASTFISQLFKVHCLERRWSGLTHTTSLIGLFLLLQAGAASVSPLLDKTRYCTMDEPSRIYACLLVRQRMRKSLNYCLQL